MHEKAILIQRQSDRAHPADRVDHSENSLFYLNEELKASFPWLKYRLKVADVTSAERMRNSYSGQVLSYQKMLGQLQDAGNTTTLAHYLELLAGAGMVTGLQKFAGDRARQRGSSPKLQVLNTALITAQSGMTPREARDDHEYWGRL